MIYAHEWLPKQFEKVMRIARRHAVTCALRVAMVTRDDNDGKLVCNCNGKLNSRGEPKTTPREKTLADVLEQLGLAGGAPCT